MGNESKKTAAVVQQFTIDDFLTLRKLYGCDVVDDNSPLVTAMMESRHHCCPPGGIDSVRFRYGLIDHAVDPRVQHSLQESQRALCDARMRDKQIMEMRMKYHLDLLMSRRPVPEGYVDITLPKPDREERCKNTIKMWENFGATIYRQTDYFCASMALAYFNAKYQNYGYPRYILEEVLGTQERAIYTKLWTHCNFIARPIDGSSRRFFFAELCNGILLTFCCILNDPTITEAGCGICSKGFLHPRDGGYLCNYSGALTELCG